MLTINSSFFYFAVKIATSYHNLQNDFCKIKDDGMHPRKLIQGLVFTFQLRIHYITHFKKINFQGSGKIFISTLKLCSY